MGSGLGWSGCTTTARPRDSSFFKAATQRRLILAGNLHAQDSGKLATQPRHTALQPIPAVLRHQGGDGVHQAGPVLADNGHYEQALHGPFPTPTVGFWQANPPLTASMATLRGPAEAKVIPGESPMSVP